MEKKGPRRNSQLRHFLIIHTAAFGVGRVGLIAGKKVVRTLVHHSRPVSRRSVLASVHELLRRQRVSPSMLSGVFIIIDGGTFTAVRAALTTGYAIAYTFRLPVATAPAALWDAPSGYFRSLRKDYAILASYSSPPSITRPKQHR